MRPIGRDDEGAEGAAVKTSERQITAETATLDASKRRSDRGSAPTAEATAINGKDVLRCK